MAYIAPNWNGIYVGYSSVFHEGFFTNFTVVAGGIFPVTGTTLFNEISLGTGLFIGVKYNNGVPANVFTGSIKSNTGIHQDVAGVYGGLWSGSDNYGDTVNGDAIGILAADGTAFFYTINSGGGTDGGFCVLNAQNQIAGGFSTVSGVSANGSVSSATDIWSGNWSQTIYLYPSTYNFLGTYSLSRVAYLQSGINPTISTTSTLPSGSVGVFYSQTLQASGGTTPYSWSVSSGSLPSGFSLSSGGVMSGTPSATGTFSFIIRCAGTDSLYGQQAFSLMINPSQTAAINVQANPSNGGSVGGGGSYTVGSSQQIFANASSGWMFTGWSDGGSQTHNITVPAGGATYTANFSQQQQTSGSITSTTFSGANGLYDLTYSLTSFSQDFYNKQGDVVTISEDLSVVQSITGALTAGEAYTTASVNSTFYDFTFPATYTLKGSVKSSGSKIQMSLALNGRGSAFVDGATRQLSESITYLATLDPTAGIMTIRESGMANESGQGSSKIINPNYSGPVLPQFTDICTPIDWYLGMTLATNGTKVTGNATVNLANGRSFPFNVTGTYTARTDTSKLTLTGTDTGGTDTAKGAKLTVTMTRNHITGVAGSLLGQKINLSGL